MTGKHSCPKALVSPRGKGLYFPRTCNDQVRYQCDGLYVVIHIREDGVFYLVCGEPRRMLGHLFLEYPPFLKQMSHFNDENGHGINRDLTTEEVCCIVPPFDINNFCDWYPNC